MAGPSGGATRKRRNDTPGPVGRRRRGSGSKDTKDQETLRETCIAFVEGGTVGGVMMIMTLFALFGPDLQLLSFPKSADPIFEVLYTLTFFLFLAELLALAILKPEYFPRLDCASMATPSGWKRYAVALFDPSGPAFYFWLDLIACLSLIAEIEWMLPAPDNEETFSTTSNTNGGAAEQLNTARASRVSRVGARAGRIVRIVRMVRLVRIVKLYKLVSKEAKVVEVEVEQEIPDDRLNEAERRMKREAEGRRKKREAEAAKRRGDTVAENAALEEAMRTTSVGQDLSDRTTKTVIMGVLLMLVAIPLISYDGYDGSQIFGGDVVHLYGVANWSSGDGAMERSINVSADYLFAQQDVVKLALGMPSTGITYLRNDVEVIELLRPVEMLKLRLLEEGGAANGYTTEIWYSLELEVQELASWGIGLTVFVMILLCVGAMMFSIDADRLVLHPIENMVDVVQEIGRNPLATFPEEEEDDEDEDVMETTVLLRTIKKIGGLLRVGFGEAGAAIIAANLNKSAELDPLLPGKNIWAVFGFCDIRNFTDTTECVKEEIMGFVNRIADIVHSTVHRHGGAANKNVGDAFLVTWKLKQSKKSGGGRTSNLGGPGGGGGAASSGGGGNNRRQSAARRKSRGGRKIGMAMSATQRIEQSRLAQQALVSFVKVVHYLNERNDEICQFSEEHHAELMERMPGFKVRLGFGLHVGWAIEGAIGSDKKIDASYLSPNVNLSETLEGTTKVYGCGLLMSGQFHHILPTPAQALCRHIDRVIFGGHSGSQSTYHDLFCADVVSVDVPRDRTASGSEVPLPGSAAAPATGESGSPRRPADAKTVAADASASGGAARASRVTNRRTSRKPSAFGGRVGRHGHADSPSAKATKGTNVIPTDDGTSEEIGISSSAKAREALILEGDIRHDVRTTVSDMFRTTQASAMKHYLSGEWTEALELFAATEALARGGEDKPTQSVVGFMRSFPDCKAPGGWAAPGHNIEAGKVQWRPL